MNRIRIIMQAIDNQGWEQEGGRSDLGDYVVRVWRGDDEAEFRAKRYRELPGLYVQALAYVSRRRVTEVL